MFTQVQNSDKNWFISVLKYEQDLQQDVDIVNTVVQLNIFFSNLPQLYVLVIPLFPL